MSFSLRPQDRRGAGPDGRGDDQRHATCERRHRGPPGHVGADHRRCRCRTADPRRRHDRREVRDRDRRNFHHHALVRQGRRNGGDARARGGVLPTVGATSSARSTSSAGRFRATSRPAVCRVLGVVVDLIVMLRGWPGPSVPLAFLGVGREAAIRLIDEQADDPDRRRRPAVSAGDRPRPARPLRRRLPGRARRRRAPRRSTCWPSWRCATEPVALIASDQRMPGMTGIEMLAQARSTRPTPSSCCSRRTPTPTSRSGRSTTSGSTTTCSSRGTRPRSGSTRSSTTCSATGGAAHPDHVADVRVVGHRWSERSHEIKTFLARNHVPYRWFDVERDDEAQRLHDARRTRAPTTCRWCSSPTARRCARRRPLDLAGALGLRTTRRAAALRPVHRRRRAGRAGRRGVRRVRGAAAPSSSSARHPAARPGRARRSRTTSASRRGCPAPTSPTGRSPRSTRFGAEMVLARDVVGFETRGPGARRAASTARARSRRAR